MRKLAILVPVFAFLAFAQLASAQQGDIMIGGGTLISSSPATGVGNFQQPAEKGGAYINITGDVITFKRRIGFGVETAWRASQGNYSDYEGETYRPILTDFNAVFQPKITKKIGADLFGGIGIASTRFYVPEGVSCSYFSGCINYSSSDHFMEDLGGGLRYYVWHHFFVRPEIHYYHIQNNVEFNSDNVFRVGGSIGYTIGND
ncbi:MAG: hypothetical protein WBD68_20535 [Candidatus Sulfotelmatobacter sp.]